MAKQKEKKDDTPPCCQGCLIWQSAGKDCWYFWEGKKHCTMWVNSPEVLAQRGQ